MEKFMHKEFRSYFICIYLQYRLFHEDLSSIIRTNTDSYILNHQHALCAVILGGLGGLWLSSFDTASEKMCLSETHEFSTSS